MENLANSEVVKSTAPDMDGEFNIAISGVGEDFSCKAGQSILAAMIAAGQRTIPVGCRSGGCGVCRIRVVEGRCNTGRMNRAVISDADEAIGILLACKALPTSNMTIELSPLQRCTVMLAKDLAA